MFRETKGLGDFRLVSIVHAYFHLSCESYVTYMLNPLDAEANACCCVTWSHDWRAARIIQIALSIIE